MASKPPKPRIFIDADGVKQTGCNFHKLHIRLIRLDAFQARTGDGGPVSGLRSPVAGLLLPVFGPQSSVHFQSSVTILRYIVNQQLKEHKITV
jgi:hypothetical protein